METELLAPAGDIEAGYAALFYGADAVYLGLQKFSARATAINFDEEALNEFTGYAHSKGKKVYAAINTLVLEKELPDLLEQLDICRRCHVDAVIIQDLGVARIVRNNYPMLEMHASTQMAVHNKKGAIALKKMGFSRVVIARELDLSEIKEIAAIPNLETEAFIHGALCYSYSGLCLFSAMESGCSANRGKCLYPCRSLFKGPDGEAHYFSMKDMALQEDVLKMPVTSLKIEGRKKNALYVAAVTDYYRRILDGKGADVLREENIRQIFSRPWCKFHFNGKNKDVVDREFVGHRGLFIGVVEQVSENRLIFFSNHKIARYDGLQIDVPGEEKPFGFSVQQMREGKKNVFEVESGTRVEVCLPPRFPKLQKGLKIYLASATDVKGAYSYEHPRPGEFRQREKLDVKVMISKTKIIANAKDVVTEINGNFEVAQNQNKAEDEIRKSFAKSGETSFALGRLDIENPQKLFVPVSLLNELRRQLYAMVPQDETKGRLPVTESRREILKKAKLIVKTDDVTSLKLLDFSKIAEIIIALEPEADSSSWKFIPRNKIRLALPAVNRNMKIWQRKINELLQQGYKKWEIANYWGLEVLPDKGIDLSFDSPLYMMNSQAVQSAKECGAARVTLAMEDCADNKRQLAEQSVLPLCLIVYQDVPLFTSAVCIRSVPCNKCDKKTQIYQLEREGRRYTAVSKNCQTTVVSPQPIDKWEDVAKIKIDFWRLDFMYKNYSAQQVSDIVGKAMAVQEIAENSELEK